MILKKVLFDAIDDVEGKNKTVNVRFLSLNKIIVKIAFRHVMTK